MKNINIIAPAIMVNLICLDIILGGWGYFEFIALFLWVWLFVAKINNNDKFLF